jgi:hypothetical protein
MRATLKTRASLFLLILMVALFASIHSLAYALGTPTGVNPQGPLMAPPGTTTTTLPPAITSQPVTPQVVTPQPFTGVTVANPPRGSSSPGETANCQGFGSTLNCGQGPSAIAPNSASTPNFGQQQEAGIASGNSANGVNNVPIPGETQLPGTQPVPVPSGAFP